MGFVRVGIVAVETAFEEIDVMVVAGLIKVVGGEVGRAIILVLGTLVGVDMFLR